MHDSRLEKLADVLTTHSTKVQSGEYVLIEGSDIPEEMIIALIRAVRGAGGIPLVEIKQNRIQRETAPKRRRGRTKADWRIRRLPDETGTGIYWHWWQPKHR